MAEKKWNVGDPVVIEHAQYHHRHGQPYEPKLSHGVVTKVARKYFTAEIAANPERFGSIAHTDEFEIANGIQRGNPDYTQYRDHAYTPAEWESEVFRREIDRRLRDDHKVHSNNLGTMRFIEWSNGHLVELLALLDRVKAENEKKDLDHG